MGLDGAKAELYKAHQTGREKYTYFLLAAAGAAIGFAVQKTEELKLSWWLLPVGLATLAWALSFICGCKNVTYTNATLSANMDYLDVKAGHNPDPTIPHHIFVHFLKEDTNKHSRKAQTYSVWQFRFLIGGALLFIVWRIAEMVRIS